MQAEQVVEEKESEDGSSAWLKSKGLVKGGTGPKYLNGERLGV